MMSTEAFNALKQPAGRGGGGAAMRSETPEKMGSDMQVLELIDELKTRKNGDDMSWDSSKHIVSSYPGIKTKFNNYLNKHQSDAVWRAKSQAEQVREFITGFLDGFDDPGVRAKDAVEKALRFRQKTNMTTSTYLELKELRFDKALREGNTAGHVDTRIREGPERSRRRGPTPVRGRWYVPAIRRPRGQEDGFTNEAIPLRQSGPKGKRGSDPSPGNVSPSHGPAGRRLRGGTIDRGLRWRRE